MALTIFLAIFLFGIPLFLGGMEDIMKANAKGEEAGCNAWYSTIFGGTILVIIVLMGIILVIGAFSPNPH